ncbi:hypothetical protein CR513_38869, partial [Mucuna pruriens]
MILDILRQLLFAKKKKCNFGKISVGYLECRIALGRDWADMVSTETHPTRSWLSANRRNRVGMTLSRMEKREIGGLNNQARSSSITPVYSPCQP